MKKNYGVYFLFLFLVAMDAPARAAAERFSYGRTGLRALGILSTLLVGNYFVEACVSYFYFKRELRSVKDNWEKRSPTRSFEAYVRKYQESTAKFNANRDHYEAEMKRLSKIVVGESEIDKTMIGSRGTRTLWCNPQKDEFVEIFFEGKRLLLSYSDPMAITDRDLQNLNYRKNPNSFLFEEEDAKQEDENAKKDFNISCTNNERNMKNSLEGAVAFGSIAAIGTFCIASDLGLFDS